MVRIKPPAWLLTYAALESSKLLLSYTGPCVGYNRGRQPVQWFLCKCNSKQKDHQPCQFPFKYLMLAEIPTVDIVEWCNRMWLRP